MISLHLIDLENLLGNANPRPTDVKFAYAAYAMAAEPDTADRWVLATSHRCAHRAWLAWPDPSCQRLLRSGHDGADLALLGYLEVPQNLNRVDCVVLGSGDGIFAQKAAELRATGLRVVVVTRPGSLSRSLRNEVDEVRFVPKLGSATNDTDLTMHA
jgi:hypothetical protein